MIIYTFLNQLLEKQTRITILRSIVTVVDLYNSNIVLHTVHCVSCVRFTRRFGSWLYSREHNFFSLCWQIFKLFFFVRLEY
jgi:hypothetical protein